MSDSIETVKVVAKDPEAGAFVIINREDFDPSIHELFEGELADLLETSVTSGRGMIGLGMPGPANEILTLVGNQLAQSGEAELADLLAGIEAGSVVVFSADAARVPELANGLSALKGEIAKVAVALPADIDPVRIEAEGPCAVAADLLQQQAAQIASLTDQLAEAREALAAAQATAGDPGNGDAPDLSAASAVHRGRGSYSVMVGDEEVVAGLSKDEADTFNAGDADAKAAFIASHKPQE